MSRRLAAIMVADVVGYSRLMGADEAGTLANLKQRRLEILDPTVRTHGGRVVKVMGDGVLIEFASAVNAVKAALELQIKFAEANQVLPENRRIVLRIGINLGDVIGEGSDIYGDGVNIAARLEGIAEPGGLCVSAKVHAEVKGKVEVSFVDLGERVLKNIALPLRVYSVETDGDRGLRVDPKERFLFGPFVLNPEEGTLVRQGVPVPVGYRGLLLITSLIRRAGEVLKKSDLMDAAWHGTAVEEGNLSVQIMSLIRVRASAHCPSTGQPIAHIASTMALANQNGGDQFTEWKNP